MARFKDFAAFATWLDGLGLFHMDLGLGRMEAFFKARGRGPGFPLVQVVGTNGKGSTSTFLASLARAHGLRTGLYTSPHFVSIRERLLLDGAMFSEARWTALAERTLDLGEGFGLTYFEVLTALAVLALDEAGADLGVFEAGLGGRFDATTALPARVVLFAPIGLDHEKILGPTLADIARDKAGAIRPGVVAVTGPQEPEVLDLLRARAREVGVPLHLAADLAEVPPDAELGLRGPHQTDNARLALAGWRLAAPELGLFPEPLAERKGLARAFLPGRLQSVDYDPPLILDGGHNAHALTALKAALESLGIRPRAVIFTCLADKTQAPLLPLVQSLTDGAILVPGLPDNERSSDPVMLAVRLGPRAFSHPDMESALAALKGLPGPVLVCGSLYLLAEFYKKNPWSLTSPQTTPRPGATS